MTVDVIVTIATVADETILQSTGQAAPTINLVHNNVTSCYSNCSESPHRRGVTLLLRAIGCGQWAKNWTHLLCKGVEYYVPKVPCRW